MAVKKSWKEKLVESKGLPKVESLDGRMRDKWGVGTIVIPAPLEVDEIMKMVPKRKLITINEIREYLAKKHHATIGCPFTTGIFAWIAAYAAEEDRAIGMKNITPYWRTLKTGGIVNEKYPGGVPHMKELLEAEGHRVIKKGKSYVVENYQVMLARL
jgi:hypothetical protein